MEVFATLKKVVPDFMLYVFKQLVIGCNCQFDFQAKLCQTPMEVCTLNALNGEADEFEPTTGRRRNTASRRARSSKRCQVLETFVWWMMVVDVKERRRVGKTFERYIRCDMASCQFLLLLSVNHHVE
jgi:hypothetical protein